jgi:hypothetical protein
LWDLLLSFKTRTDNGPIDQLGEPGKWEKIEGRNIFFYGTRDDAI